MSKNIFKLLIAASLIILAFRFGFSPLLVFLGFQSKAGLKISASTEAVVFLDDQKVGKTPFQNDALKAGEYKVALVSEEGNWQGRVLLSGGTLSLINREIAPTATFSSGETLTLQKGTGAVIVSTPGGVQVEVDGKIYGQTPTSLSNLGAGEHIFVLSRQGYLSRSIRATIPSGMMLAVSVDLAMAENFPAAAVPTLTSIPKLKVGQTPTGFLRVRERPSLNGKEIGKVSSGDILIFIEETPGWFKVRMDNDIEGFVSSQYIEKQ